MLTLVKIIQYIGILVILWGLVIIYPRKLSMQKQLLVIILAAMLINEIGYALELSSTTMEAAILSIKVAYVGKLIAELGIFFFVLAYCKVKIPKWVQYLLIGVHLVVAVLVWSCEKNPLYYSSIDYTQEGLFPHVILGHGIAYQIFTVITFLYMGIMLVVSAIAIARATRGVERKRVFFMLAVPISFIIGLMVYRTNITQGYDTTAPAYVVCTVILIISLLRYDLFDEKEVAKDIIIDEIGEAVFVINSNDEIIYMNSKFMSLFPKISKGKDKNVVKTIMDYSQKDREFEYSGLYYKINKKEIIIGGEDLGDIYMLYDVTESHRRMELVDKYNKQLKHDVAEKTEHLKVMQNKLILGMADMVENRDLSTGGHIKRTSQVIEILITEMRKDESLHLENDFCDSIIKAAPMHDLGKIGVDDEVLRKPGKFTPEEYEQMKTHAEKGARLVRQLLRGIEDDYFAVIAENVAHYHHERYDGTGYPNHLVGDDIPYEARIMAIVDVYDALVSKRCYKESMSFEEANKIILGGMGTQFDPKLEKYYTACRERFEQYYREHGDDSADENQK